MRDRSPYSAQDLEQFEVLWRDEVELIYRAKGMDASQAAALAERIMADPDIALDTLAREELGPG